MSQANPIVRKKEPLSQNIRGRAVATPPADVFENDDGFLLRLDLPGVDPEKVDIALDKGELSINGAWSLPDPEGQLVGSEYRATDYHRRFQVPDSIDADQISATLEQGVLQVLLPKSEALKPRSIQVSAG